MQLSLDVTPPYSLELTCLSHGWINLAPFEWDKKDKVVRTKLELADGRVASVSAQQVCPDKINLCISDLINPSQENVLEIEKRVSRAFSLEFDVGNLLEVAFENDVKVADLILRGGGRILRGTTYFEDVVKTLFTTNASWQYTQRMVRTFIAIHGNSGAFPSFSSLECATEDDYRNKVKVGYRARFLRQIVETFITNNGNVETLSAFPGLGPYGFAHVRLLALDFSRIPIDSEVKAYCKENYSLTNEAEIHKRFESWGEYAFLGYKLGRQARRLNWIGD